MITQIIDILRQGDFYGAGEFTEIAKGKHEIARDLKTAKKKIIRLWQSKK